MSQKTRSSLTIDAVAQAAATGVAGALNPLNKINQIAALAGFVLRLFRSKRSSDPVAGPIPAKIRPGSGRAVRKQSGRRKGGLRHG